MPKFNVVLCTALIAYTLPAMAQISAMPSKPIVPTSITGGEESTGKKYKPKPKKSSDKTADKKKESDPTAAPDLDEEDTKKSLPDDLKDIPPPNVAPDIPMPDMDDM